MSSHTRLTMKPFPEKPIDNVASTSICVRTELEANRGVSGGASHKFNAICQGRETAQIVCNALTSAHTRSAALRLTN